MIQKFKVLVFPCGSEIGLEIYRSLRYSAHVELYGASSVDDHGKFIYENYIGNIPFVDAADFVAKIAETVKEFHIDAIYPAMDKVIWVLKKHEQEIGCKVIASNYKTTEICLSKTKTYKELQGIVNIPKVYKNVKTVNDFPVFIKPDIGYGSRGVFKAMDKVSLNFFMKDKIHSDYVISEYLPGREYTVDCFTNKEGKLIFCGPRIRNRISNGISVNTIPVNDINNDEFKKIAIRINENIAFQGAWFFQVKRNNKGELTILEIAARLGGSSSLYRGKGINFALISIYDAFNLDVEILENSYDIELDRALDSKFKLNVDFETVYVDYDDCLIVGSKVNIQLLSFLFDCLNKGKKIVLLSKHEGNLIESLKNHRLNNLFDKIIHISKNGHKSDYITDIKSIFIDDSFAERKNIKKRKNIFVFSPDMIEILL